jgi:hypothetical protein
VNKFLLWVFFLFFIGSVSGQEISTTTLGEDFSNLPFNKFSEKLLKEKNIRMLYDPSWTEKLISPEINTPVLLPVILANLLDKAELHYIEMQGNIVIIPGRNQLTTGKDAASNVLIVGNPLNKGKFRKATVSGYIYDGKSKTTIPGAQIYCETISRITTSDKNGYFRLELPTGQHTVKFSFVGLDDEVREVMVYNDGEIEVELYEKSISLGQINVMADRPEDNYRSTSMGMVKLSMKSIKKLSVLMGETDIIKSMVMLPGVQSTGENASGFNVRGGNIDQNLILIHEAPVYNTSHMFGLFSMIDPIVVNDVTLYKSGIPSKYGGRISSVLNIELRKPEPQKFKVNGGIGIINSRLSIEGPIIKDKLSFMAGFRTTYSDWVLKMVKNYQIQQSSVSFYDFNAKIDYTINSNNRLSIFGYGSNDYFNYYGQAEYGYGNLIGALKYNHIINDRSSGSLNINYSRYKSDLVDYSTKNFEYKMATSIEQEQVAYNFSTTVLPRHQLSGGISVIRYYVEPGNAIPQSENSAAAPINIEDETGYEAALFVEDEFELFPGMAVIAGLRYSAFAKTGPLTMNTYMDDMPLNENTVTGSKEYGALDFAGFYHLPEPRLAVRYELKNSSSIKAGYNRTAQYIRQISNSASITPADFWKSSDQYMKPLISDQYSIGYFKNFKNNAFETSVELYYKENQNETDYKNGARLILNPEIEQALIYGIGKAYGAELMLKKSTGKLTGWVAYTYSRSFRQIEGEFPEETINRGEWYPSTYDKPHDLTVVMNYKLSRRFTFAANFTYSTGRPITLPEYKYNVGSYEMIYYSDRNKYRMPDYHRLDLSITYEGSLLRNQKWRSSWTLALYNAYGRHNPFSVYYMKDKPTVANNFRVYSLYQFSVIGVPIPSFTYNFWF